MSIFEGKLIIFAAPSGAGKTTIVRHILQKFEEVKFSVSATTRQPREGEKEGVHYYYLSLEEFTQKIKSEEFIEYEQVYEDIYYGTLKVEVERLWSLHKHVIFDIDVKGALTIKKQFGSRALTIFVEPPSLEELSTRLRSRGTETEENIKKRIAKFSEELKFLTKFDKRVINDHLPTALQEAEDIVQNFIKHD